MASRGRPTLYKPEYVERARKMCLLGATNRELADGFEVDRSTIDNWLKAHPAFAAAVHEGRDGADAEIAQKLFERAKGCSYEATRIVVVRSEVVKVTYTVNLPPDARACMFWLRNRRRRNWLESAKREDEEEEQVSWAEFDELCEQARPRAEAPPQESVEPAAETAEASSLPPGAEDAAQTSESPVPAGCQAPPAPRQSLGVPNPDVLRERERDEEQRFQAKLGRYRRSFR